MTYEIIILRLRNQDHDIKHNNCNHNSNYTELCNSWLQEKRHFIFNYDPSWS